jgi:hypothetical protein
MRRLIMWNPIKVDVGVQGLQPWDLDRHNDR